MKDCLEKQATTKVRTLCKITGISKSTFYYNRNAKTQEEKDKEILELLHKLPKRILLRRGKKAKSKEIKKRFNKTVNHKKIERICKKYGLLAQNRRRKFPKDYYARQKENQKNLPKNIMNQDFSSDVPLKKLCTDVSYFKTTEGWLYLSPVLDLGNNKIICRAISNHNDENLTNDTLDFLKLEKLAAGAIMQTDMGTLYTSPIFRKRLKKMNITHSMSRKGNCWDNACMEHFFGTLKVESGYDDLLKTGLLSFEETKKLIDNFIDYYNNERIQKNLGWKTPSEVFA